MGYINHLCRFKLLAGAAEAIKLLNDAEIPVVVISNQSGLARGYFPEELLVAVHEKMDRLLAEKGAHVDGIYYCPHHPEGVIEKFRRKCACRKPGTGLLLKASGELDIDLSRSYVVGDKISDIQLAHNAGCTGIMVRTGYGSKELDAYPEHIPAPHRVCRDIQEAAMWILDNSGKT